MPVTVLSPCLQGETNTLPTHILDVYIGPVLNEDFGHLQVRLSAADMESCISTNLKYSIKRIMLHRLTMLLCFYTVAWSQISLCCIANYYSCCHGKEYRSWQYSTKSSGTRLPIDVDTMATISSVSKRNGQPDLLFHNVPSLPGHQVAAICNV